MRQFFHQLHNITHSDEEWSILTGFSKPTINTKICLTDRSLNHIPTLPPSAEIENDPEILKKLVSASRALAKVDGNINRLPNPLMLVNTIALQEAKTSTEIENIFRSEDELYNAVSDSVKERNTDPATKEVLKYREALWTGYKLILETGKIDHKSKIKWYNKEVNELLFSQPCIKAGSIGKVVDKSSRTTLTKYMNELSQHKVLTPTKDGLEVYYLNNDLVRILEG